MGRSGPGCGAGDAAGGGERLFWPATAQAPRIAPLRRPLSWLAVGAIKCYQRTLSRLWPNVCRFHPSCSHYAIHAIAGRGLVMGCVLGAWRILRCNPFSPGGYDPPPGYEEALTADEQETAPDKGEKLRTSFVTGLLPNGD